MALSLATAQTATASDDWAEFWSGTGNTAYLAAGLTLPLLRDGAEGKAHFWRGTEALAVTVGLTYSLKGLTHVRRPDGSGNDSFPSGHASAAFCLATIQAEFHPSEAVWWYVGAGLIAQSRVQLNRHRVGDVLAGALLGHAVAKWELAGAHGWFIAPLVSSEGYGLGFATRF